MPRSRSSGALSIVSNERNAVLRVVLRQHLRDRRRQRRLAVIDVTDRPNVYVRFGLRSNFSFAMNYLMISEIVPAPTVRPPSRIAKRRPFSMATGVCSVISSWMLSPGITISVPSGSFADPVTSVVRK